MQLTHYVKEDIVKWKCDGTKRYLERNKRYLERNKRYLERNKEIPGDTDCRCRHCLYRETVTIRRFRKRRMTECGRKDDADENG